MELRGTRKILSDNINNPVRVMGFSSIEFASSLTIIAFTGIIMFFLGGVIASAIVVIPSLWVFASMSKKIKKSQEKGIDKPFMEMIMWNTVPKKISQSQDFKSIYGSKRSS